MAISQYNLLSASPHGAADFFCLHKKILPILVDFFVTTLYNVM